MTGDCTANRENWLLTIAYDGTDYAGWQTQPNAVTVQGTIEEQLFRLYQQPVEAAGCSRTDSGVHALSQHATVHPPATPAIGADNVRRALQRALPSTIQLLDLVTKPAQFHARFNAVGKAYVYVLHAGPLKSPFIGRYSWEQPEHLDLAAMQSAAPPLCGRQDFTTFSANSGMPDRDHVRCVHRIDFRRIGNFICVVVVGDGFLYRMVRRIVGFLVAVGGGRLSPDCTTTLLTKRDRNAGFNTAPPHGLFLDSVFYTHNAMKAYHLRQLPFLQWLSLPDPIMTQPDNSPLS